MKSIKSNGKRIRELRKEEGLNQKQLASKIYINGKAINEKMVQRFENKGGIGKFTKKTLKALSEYFEIDSDELFIQSKDKNSNALNSKIFYLNRIYKGEELFDILRRNGLPIVHDYSTDIEGKDTMELVVSLFHKIWELHARCTGDHEKYNYPSSANLADVDLEIAPILAGMHANNVGLFAKLFCTVSKSTLKVEEYESYLCGPQTGGDYFRNHNFQEMTFALLIYASKLNADDEKKSELQNPSLSENYLKAKFKWHIHDIYADEDTNQKIGINPKEERYLKDSEAVGFIEWWNFKEDKYPNRMKEFWESEYFGSLREEIYNNYLCDEYGLDDDLNQIKIDFDYKKYDEDSIEAGKKLAAIVWNAWEIFNRRAPYWNNKFLKSIEKEHLNRNEFFPDIKSTKWFGPKNTEIDIYKRIRYDNDGSILGREHEDWDYFENEYEEKLPTTFDDDGNLLLLGESIPKDLEFIGMFSPTEKFKQKIDEFYKKIENGDYGNPIKPPEDINADDLIAFHEAFEAKVLNIKNRK